MTLFYPKKRNFRKITLYLLGDSGGVFDKLVWLWPWRLTLIFGKSSFILVKSKFSHFKSRCTIRLECRYSTDLINCLNKYLDLSSSIAPFCCICLSRSPCCAYSITMKILPSLVARISVISTTNLCLTRCRTSISRGRKWLTKSRGADDLLIIFTATFFRRCVE